MSRTISDALRLAAGLRVPVFPRDAPPGVRSAGMEEFMLVSAFHAGNLHEERLEAHAALEPLKREWELLEGWQALQRGKTVESMNAAKRTLRPDLHDKISDLGWTIRRLTEELDRLERDATKVSRAYTMLMGA